MKVIRNEKRMRKEIPLAMGCREKNPHGFPMQRRGENTQHLIDNVYNE